MARYFLAMYWLDIIVIGHTYTYETFGSEREESVSGTDPNPFRYCGEYYDTETGSIYLRARYYAPGTGRFTQADTLHSVTRKMPNGQEIVNPLSLNLYAYCYNNPVAYVDYSGHVPAAVAVYVASVLSSPDLQMDINFLALDIANGDYLAAFFDAVGILVPGGTGFGSTAKGVAKSIWKFFGGKTDDAIRAVKATFGDGKIAMGYKALKAVVEGCGLEVHHLIEKRFAGTLKIKADEILSIAIDSELHQQITSLMRKKIGYQFDFGNKPTTFTATLQEIWDATVEVYTELKLSQYLDPLKQQLIDNGNNLVWGSW